MHCTFAPVELHRDIMKFGKTIPLRLPGVEPGSIAWKAIILTVGLQTLVDSEAINYKYHYVFGSK